MEDLQVEDGTDERDEDSSSPSTTSAFNASFIRYEKDDGEREELARAASKVKKLPKFLLFLGVEEIFLPSMWKACLIECFGMAVFTYAHVAIISASLSYTYPPLLIAIFHGFLIALFIVQFAASSGAHFNSLITFATITTGHTTFVRGMCYIPSQMLGAFIGALCMKTSMVKAQALAIGLGSCNLGDSLDVGQGLMIEVFFSFLLLFASYGLAFNAKQREIYGPILAPIFVGVMLALVIFSSASLAPPPFTGAGANPSLCFGTAAALSLYEEIGNSEGFKHHWIYWVGPGISALIHAGLYLVAPPHHHDLYEKEKQKKLLKRKRKDKKSID